MSSDDKLPPRVHLAIITLAGQVAALDDGTVDAVFAAARRLSRSNPVLHASMMQVLSEKIEGEVLH